MWRMMGYFEPVGKPGRHKTRPSNETSRSGVFQRAAKTSRTATAPGQREASEEVPVRDRRPSTRDVIICQCFVA
jgi:hypothetical protein